MSAFPPQDRPLKIIIVGGGIAGLTLANALQDAPANIEYLIIEGRKDLAPQLGAGIALLPNGSRILDQLGVYAELEANFDPIVSSSVLNSKGRPLLPERIDGAKLLGIRMSYPLALVQRVSLLQVLERRLQPGKGRVLTGKKVQRVEQDEKGVSVYCADGSSYHGDIVVGADGVRSKVREEMWRNSAEKGFGNIDVEKERRAMTAEYKCLFGISKPVDGLGPGTSDDTWDKGKTVVVYSGERGKLFWFLYEKMDRIYHAHEIPRYDNAEALKFAHDNLDMPILPGGSVKFAHVWEAREVATMLPLEEAHFSSWTAGRIVCLGDSVHKMTPHSGAGGMTCIETAAALANSLVSLCRVASIPSHAQIEAALRQYETGPNKLHGRAVENIKASRDLADLCALDTLAQRVLVPYLVPLSLDIRVDMFCDMAVGAPYIEYLPIPPRSMQGTMPFNPSHGMAKKENRWLRALLAFPLAVLAVVSFVVIVGLVPFEPIYEVFRTNIYRPINGGTPIRIMQQLFKVPFIDDFTRVSSFEFVVSRENCFSLMLTFYADYGLWYAITLIESARRANNLTILTPIFVWGMLNTRGIALFGALWKFSHYILSPIEVFDAPDARLTDKSYTTVALPSILITHFATYLGAFLASDPTTRQMAGHLWALFPLFIWLGRNVAVRFLMKPSTVSRDRLYNPTADLTTIRRTVAVLVIISTIAWQYTIWSGQSLSEIYIPALPIPHVNDLSLDAAYVEFLKWDTIFFALGNILWLWLLFWDLKAAGMVRTSWASLMACGLAVSVVGGTGSLLGLAWLYREETLVRKRHKDAVVPGNPAVKAPPLKS